MKKIVVLVSLMLSCIYANMAIAEPKCMTVENLSSQAIILSPSNNLNLKITVRPHFAGNLYNDNFDDPSCRTGWFGCYVLITNKDDGKETAVSAFSGGVFLGSRIFYYGPNDYYVKYNNVNC